MKETLTTKPEPLPAKPRWHYDSYFIAQLQRQHPQINADNELSDSATEENQEACNQQLETQRNEIIKRIMELADSIGVSARIIDQC